MNPLRRAPRSEALFRQLAQDTDESATAAQFIQLYRQSAALRLWLKEDYSRDAKSRTHFDALATAETIPSVERFAELADEGRSWTEERRQLKTRLSDRVYGGLTYKELEKLILRYKSGTIDKGAFLLAQEWRRAEGSAAFSPVLARAAVTLVDAALRSGELGLLRHLAKAARFLIAYDNKPKRKAAVGFTDWWKLQALFFILKYPRGSYRTRELRAHLSVQGLDVSTKDIRRFCSRHGIRRDMRAGRPLGQLQLATAVALAARMIGEAPDVDTQQIRQALLAQYIHQTYEDTFEEWSKRHRELLPQIERMACATHRWRQQKMPPGATDLEAFAELRDRTRAGQDEAHQFIADIGEEEITRFLKQPQTERAVIAMAHAHYTPQDYPVHASLVELMQFSRFPEHKKEEIDHLATLLSAWTAQGHHGRLFDGPTNISLTSNIAHFELGYIPEQSMELKTAAGLLITGFSRQHIISLPRAQWKRIIFEELARFLDVPGGEKIVAESYAQLRKFNCWTASIVQQYSKFKDTRIRPVVIGNSKQFFLMRQFDRSDLEDISRVVALPEAVCASIQNYPMPEQQPEGKKFSSLCFFSPVTDPPLCGTVRNVQIIKEASREKLAV